MSPRPAVQRTTSDGVQNFAGGFGSALSKQNQITIKTTNLKDPAKLTKKQKKQLEEAQLTAPLPIKTMPKAIKLKDSKKKKGAVIVAEKVPIPPQIIKFFENNTPIEEMNIREI